MFPECSGSLIPGLSVGSGSRWPHDFCKGDQSEPGALIVRNHKHSWSRLRDLNPQPSDYKSDALPIAPSRRGTKCRVKDTPLPIKPVREGIAASLDVWGRGQR